MRALVIGIGNASRGDDAAGLAVAQRLQQAGLAGVDVLSLSGEAAALIDAWSGAERVVLVDSCTGDSAPGSIQSFEAASGPLPAALLHASTHSLGVAEAVELARSLGRLPKRLTVYGITARSFEPAGLSPEVAGAAERLAEELAAELARKRA